MKVLLTGFEPFGGEHVNPAWEAVKRLPDELDGAQLVKREICVEYDRAPQQLRRAMEETQPDIVICVGQAGGRAGVTPEYVAINVADAASADNAGMLRSGERLIADAPDAYFTTLPVREMVAAMRAAEIPASVSYTAGTYVCNCVMYSALHAARPGMFAGFIHVPFSTAQAAARTSLTPSLPLNTIVRALEISTRAAIAAWSDQQTEKY